MRSPVLSCASLPLMAAAALAQGTPEIEGNDMPATATMLTAGTQGDAAIGTQGDVDFWEITLAAESDLRCWINPGRGQSLANSDMAIIATDGTTEIAFNDDSISPPSWLSALAVGRLAAGRYYVRVRSSQMFDPNGTGTYTLDVVAAPPGTYVVNGTGSTVVPTPVTEGAEANDPRLTGGVATPAFENTIARGQVAAAAPAAVYTAPGADYDFYEITVTRPGLLRMEMLPTAAFPAMRNTLLFLADATLAPLASDDDGGFGRFSLLSSYVFPGTHYVVVAGKDTGNYELDVRLIPMAPLGAATVTVQSGGCGPALSLRQTAAGPPATTERPVLGSAYYVDGSGLPPNALVIHVIGTDLLTPPYDMGPIGAPGCQIEVDPIDQSIGMARPNGEHFWRLNVPLKLALIGLTIEQQLAVIDQAANPLGLTVTNRISSSTGVHH